jgi:hypothetical protein
MKNEDGVNSGARNIGRFFLFAIPSVSSITAPNHVFYYDGSNGWSTR